MRRIAFNSESGVILPIVIILMVALTITGIAFLSASVLEHNLAMREVYKTQAFFLADGGIEHLRSKLGVLGAYEIIKAKDLVDSEQYGPYQPAVGEHELKRALGEGGYWVGHYGGSSAYVLSIGQVIKGGEITKAVEDGQEVDVITYGEITVEKKIKMDIDEISLFHYGILAKLHIEMKGVGSEYKVSGYDSRLPPEDPTQPTGDATVACNSALTEAVTLQNAQISGTVYVGPGPEVGDALSMGPQGNISGGATNLEVEIPVPSVSLPSELESLGDLGPLIVSGEPPITITGPAYYSSITVKGEGILYMDGRFLVDTLNIAGGGTIIIEADDYLELYVTGQAIFSGNGIMNESHRPERLLIFGLDSCGLIDVGGTADFYGAVYTPMATIECSGSNDIHGSLVANEVGIGGTPHIHHDLALGGYPGLPLIPVLTNWQEVS